jgi:hypothetical protein
MISQEQLAQEFLQVVDRVYPKVGRLLHRCYVKVVDFYIRRLGKRFYYIIVYGPDYLIPALELQQEILKDIAEHMAMIDVVFISVSKAMRAPMSKLKQEDFRFWLELNWVASQDE